VSDPPRWPRGSSGSWESLLASAATPGCCKGPSGLGQYRAGTGAGKAWLCEQPTGQGACGQCGSCHAIHVRTHADLCVLMPETVMLELGWPLSEKAQTEIDEKKRKPSKEIRIDAMRDAVEFAQRTSARGRGKAVLVYPAERMNHVTANALLKTLEEPAGDVRNLCWPARPPTSCCPPSAAAAWATPWPGPMQPRPAWLVAGPGHADAATPSLLRAAGGRPEDALLLAQSGRGPAGLGGCPRRMARGDTSRCRLDAGWQAVDTLQKLCHDLHAVKAVGAAPRFFDAAGLPRAAFIGRTERMGQGTGRHARTVEHPFNAGLMLKPCLRRPPRLRLP
jgi:DNA polymerase-3 subunit delta'